MRGQATGPQEAGPIRISTAVAFGTHWSALAFTLAIAVAIVAGGPYALEWSSVVLSRPAATAAPARPATPTPIPTAPPASALASAWVSQTPQRVIGVGGTTAVTITFRNTGSAEWRKGSPSEVRLGIVGPYEPTLARGWPYPERPAVQAEQVVRPGDLATFTFDVQGPRSGTFRMRLRPVMDGVAWLTDEGVYVDVEVR